MEGGQGGVLSMWCAAVVRDHAAAKGCAAFAAAHSAQAGSYARPNTSNIDANPSGSTIGQRQGKTQFEEHDQKGSE